MNEIINVFFPYYLCGDKERQKEIDLCLKKNIENEYISKLYILIDDGSKLPFTAEKVEIINLTERPTYRKWIELSIGLHGFSILCNSDIYFDASIKVACTVLEEAKTFLSLSRWELIKGQTILHPNPHWSQDVWGINCVNEFEPEMLKSLEFPMGVPRCDNKIAYLFGTRGWSVKNPCKFLKSMHVHETGMRTYHKKLDTRILGGVAYVHPGKTALCNAKLEIDIWSVKVDDFKSVAINKSMQCWINEANEANETELIQTPDSTVLDKRILTYASAKESLNAMKKGSSIYKQRATFEAFILNDSGFFKNIYNFPKIIKAEYDDINSLIVPGLIPPVLDTYITDINELPKPKNDLDFWQYPAATEKQAYENHLNIQPHEHFDLENKEVHIYVPVPWATYVDRKDFSSEYLNKIGKVVKSYQELASEFDYQLKVHTVCQHIHWIRMLEAAKKIGITDLYLSHKYSKSNTIQEELGFNFTLHPWALIAVNYVTEGRNEGMERKPMIQRTLLASFIGAHMPHYRDDSRIKLFEAAKTYGKDDVFVDLGNEWHFNKVVYEEQVLQKEIDSHHIDEHHQRTFRYNAILSDTKFSLCPEGAGPNTLRFWESIAVGSIPVVFSDDLAIFQESALGKQVLENSVIWNKEVSSELFEHLHSLDGSTVQNMQNNLFVCYEKFELINCINGCGHIAE